MRTSRRGPQTAAESQPRRGAAASSAARGLRALVFGVVAAAIVLMPMPSMPATTSHRWLRIEAGDFAFDPGVVTVNPGDEVTIELVATDVMHGLYIDEYDLEVTADPGQTASVTFVADKPGTVRFRCSVTCGPLHPFMIGKLRVGRNTLFWRGAALALLAAISGWWRVRP